MEWWNIEVLVLKAMIHLFHHSNIPIVSEAN